MGNSSSGQEEGTVLLISFAQVKRMQTYNVGLHGPVKLLGSDVGDARLIVLLISLMINSERENAP